MGRNLKDRIELNQGKMVVDSFISGPSKFIIKSHEDSWINVFVDFLIFGGFIKIPFHFFKETTDVVSLKKWKGILINDVLQRIQSSTNFYGNICFV